MKNPIKILIEFFVFIVDVLSVKIVLLISLTMVFISVLNNSFQETTLGYSLFTGFCFIIAILAFDTKFKEKPYKQKTSK